MRITLAIFLNLNHLASGLVATTPSLAERRKDPPLPLSIQGFGRAFVVVSSVWMNYAPNAEAHDTRGRGANLAKGEADAGALLQARVLLTACAATAGQVGRYH